MNRAFFLITFSLLFIEVNSQSLKIDSLKSLLPSTTADRRLDVLHALAVELVAYDSYLAIPFVNDGIRSIPQATDSFRIVRAYRDKGHLLSIHGKYDSVIVVFQSALKIARRNQLGEEINRMLNSLGIAHFFFGKYGNALQYFYETLLLRQSMGMETCTIYNNIGISYYKLRENKKALTYFKKSFQLYEDYGEAIDPGLVLINIGLCFNEMKVYDSASYYMSLGLRKSPIANEIGGQFALGLLNYRQGEVISSKIHFDKSLALSQKNCDARFICENQVYLARIHIELCEFAEAREILDNVEAILVNNKYDEVLLDALRVFVLLFKATGDFDNLSEYNQKFISLRERLYGLTAIQKIIAFQVGLEQFENTQTIRVQKKMLEFQNASFQFQNKILYIVCLGVVLTFIILVQIGYLFYRRKAVYAVLESRITDRTSVLDAHLRFQDRIEQTCRKLITAIVLDLSFRLMEIRMAQQSFGGQTKKYSDVIEQNIFYMQRLYGRLKRFDLRRGNFRS